MNKHIWLIGAGQMAVDYYQVIKDQKVKCEVIGRGELSARSFAKKTEFKPFVGGLNYFLKGQPNTCSHAIVAVGVEELLKTTKKLLKYGIKNILVEKPAGINKEEIEEKINALVKENHSISYEYLDSKILEEKPEIVRTMSVKPPKIKGKIRLVRIGNIDYQPCGGTHVNTTLEIREIKVSKVENKGRMNRRVNILLND